MSENYSLDKSVWTDADFERMSWHDATLWGMAFQLKDHEFVLDIDYIVKWESSPDDGFYRLWIAPATVVFQNVYDLRLDVALDFDVVIQDLLRADPRVPRNATFIARNTEWEWTIDFGAGSISFRAVGFKQYFRRQPVMNNAQFLPLHERGGVSFERRPDDRSTC